MLLKIPRTHPSSCLAFLLLMLLGASRLASGAVVQNCNEAGLRAALALGGVTTFACNGTITLSSPIVVTTKITLDAAGHTVRLSGGGLVRIFEVSSNASVRVSGLTISDGSTQGPDGTPAGEGRGGAVLVDHGE